MAKGRILAIDNDSASRALYQDLLGVDGHYLRIAANGRDALEWLRHEEFDLVITELQIDVDQVNITELIKRFNPSQEIVVVTHLSDVAAAVETMKRGVSEYILKPINPDEFLLLVNKILFRQSQRLEHKKLLDENIEYHQILGYYQKCLAFLQIHDLDRLGDLILDTLMELLHAEGGLLWLPGYGGQQYRLRCRRGLAKAGAGSFVPSEAERHLILAGEAVLLEQGTKLWLPLLAGMEPLALIRLEAPAGRDTFNRRDTRIAALIGEFAAGALNNVIQLRNLEQNTLRVPRGEAYTMSFFEDHVAKELNKSRRYGRSLALIKLTIDNYEELSSLYRHRELEEGVTRLVETVNIALRDADIMAMAADDEYYILLPETDYWGSLVAQKRIRKALKGKLSICDLKKSHQLGVFLRSAAFPGDGVTLEELRQTAGFRLRRLKNSLFYQAGLTEVPFWEIVGRLLGTPRDYPQTGEGFNVSEKLSRFEDSQRSRYFRMPLTRLDEIFRSFCQEVVESNRIRGIIYRGCSDFEKIRKSLRDVDGLEKSATSLFLLGGQRRVQWDYQRIVPIYIDSDRFEKIPFLLYLNEDYAYALFARARGNELVG
ncbi:MAG: response regulator, partial [Desulfuromonadaceae bacterium]